MNLVGAAGKLNEEIMRIFCDAFVRGYSNIVACAYAGISQSAYYDWLKKAKEGEEEYAEFERQILFAKAQHLAYCQDMITNAMSHAENWQAAAWSLERRDPAEYSLKRPRRLERFGEALKQFKAKEISYNDLTQVVHTMVAEAEISIEEAEVLTNSIAKSAAVEEITELKALVERLEAQIKP